MSRTTSHLLVTAIAMALTTTAPALHARGEGGAFVGSLIGAAIGTAIMQKSQAKQPAGREPARAPARPAAPKVDQEAVSLQKALAAAGYYSGPMDGKLDGYATKSAIMQFQQRYGMTPTGILTPDITSILNYQGELAELMGYLAYKGFEKKPSGQRLQAALKVEGVYNSKIDGVLGQGSKQSINLYQQSRGLMATGVLLPDQEQALVAGAIEKLNQQRAQSDSQLMQIAQRNSPQQQYQAPSQPQPAYQAPAYQAQPAAPMPVAAPATNDPFATQTAMRAPATEPTPQPAPQPAPEAKVPSGVDRPNLYILSIGVSKYADKDYNLTYADADAEAITRAFKSQQGKLYNRVETKLLTNTLADRDNILDGLEWLIRETTQKDMAVIFVAGHGTKDGGGQYYFMPHDSDMDSLRRTGVKWYEFQDTIERLPGTRWLLADTCHSGAITGKRGMTRDASDITDALRDLRKVENGVVVMSAATGREASEENSSWGHGAFTLALVEGIEQMKANFNNDHRIDIKELDLYVTNRVKELTGGRQHPMTEIPTVMPNFPVAIAK